MRYTLRVNEQQFQDMIAAILCAEAEGTEAIEPFHGNEELRDRAAESVSRLAKLRHYLQKEKEREEQ